VSVGAFETLDQVSSLNVPYSNALVEGACSNKFGVGRDGHGGYAIFDAEDKDVGPSLNIPQSDGAVTTTRSNSASVTSEIQRINVLLVTLESVPDLLRGNIPNLFESA